jgi:hypothetical protein
MEFIPHKGAKVRLSRHAPSHFKNGEFTVIGKSRNGQCAWVIRDGRKTKLSYHIHFLEIIKDASDDLNHFHKLAEKSGAKRVKL